MASETHEQYLSREFRHIDLDAYAENEETGERVWLRVSYNHSTRPSFSWKHLKTDGRVRSGSGHPRRNGFTAKNGWKVDPEQAKEQW